MERYIAIDGVCAWPNLTLLPNGETIATIFNQPCHCKWEGDVECWSSRDGRFWERRGVPAPHEPETNRMNVAAGLAKNGDLLVIASGWISRPPRPDPVPVFPHDSYDPPEGGRFETHRKVIPSWVCRSVDRGKTWTRAETVSLPEEADYFVPFGDIHAGAEGILGTTCYGTSGVWFVASRDDGKTWPEHQRIAEKYNETSLLYLGDGNWLAAARPVDKNGMGLFRSTDNGATWAFECRLSLPMQHPGHLLRLSDGRILFSCGLRNPGSHGVSARLSEDEGHTWGPAFPLVAYQRPADGGYPSSSQRADGVIVTAYYCAQTPSHERYHMGVVLWRPDEIG